MFNQVILSTKRFIDYYHMPFTEDHKKQTEKDIVEMVIGALEGSTITEGDATAIGKMVLERIDNIENQEELILFLEVLTERYPFFAPLVLKEKGKVEEKIEKQVVENVEGLIQNGNIDEALEMVKGATQN